MARIEFEVIEGWEKLPEGWSFVEVAGVATDSKDRVYAFNRGEHPMIVFDAEGNFLDAWGEGVFANAHGIYIGQDDRVYAADNVDHTVRIFTSGGELLQTLGEKDEARGYRFRAGSVGCSVWRRTLQPRHQRGAVDHRRDVRRGRLRQRPCAQVLRRR